MGRLLAILGIIAVGLTATPLLMITFSPRDAEELDASITATETPVPTELPNILGQIAKKINEWQQELADFFLAILKFTFTTVAVVLAIILVILPFIRIFSPKLGLKILYSSRRVRSRMRRPQIVVADFQNLTGEKSDYLVRIARMCIVEELRRLLARDGDLGKLLGDGASPEDFPRAPLETTIDSEIRDKFGKALDELRSEVETAEIKLLAIIVRHLIPVPGFKIKGSLVKIGPALQDHFLVIELIDLATEEVYQLHQIWCRTVPADHAVHKKPEGIKNAHYQLGLIYEAKGLYSEARTHFEEVIKENPTHQDALDILIYILERECIDTTQIYYSLAKKAALWVGSQLIADELEKGKPEKWQAERLNRLGYLFMSKEMYDEALKMFIAASEKYPEWFISYWNMGDIYSFQGQQSQSVEAYEKALKFVEKDSERYQSIQVAKASSLFLMGKEEEASSTVDQIERGEITDFSTIYNLACYFSHAGKLDEALFWLKKIKPQMRPSFLEWVRKDPDLRNIQQSPEFKEEFL